MDYLQAYDLWDELQELQDELNDSADEAADNLEDTRERYGALVELFSVIGNERAVANYLTLIPESEWETYARDWAEDLAGDAEFLFPYVDWKTFADNLRMDHETVEFDGDAYLYRA